MPSIPTPFAFSIEEPTGEAVFTKSGSWDRPTINGVVIPGVVTLMPFKISVRVQQGDASGRDFGSIICRGLDIPRANFQVEIYSTKQHEAWTDFAPNLIPRTLPDKRDVVQVYHPTLARYGYNFAFVESIEETPPRNGGPLTAKIGLVIIEKPRDNATQAPKKKAGAPGVIKQLDRGGGSRGDDDIRTTHRPKAP